VKIHKSIVWFNIFILGLMVVNLILMYFANSKLSLETFDLSKVKIAIFMLNILGIIFIIGSVSLQIKLVRKFKTKLSVQLNRFMGITDSLKEGTNNLSKRTNDQAASLEETASTMEEITATVKQNSEHSKLAVSLTNEALSVAQQGTQLSREVQGAMDEISQSSNKISDIVGLVEEIAFQTNILAINAAIEAAKAGDIGKGFAVVAIEVRDLAQRSSHAAKEIKTLIDNSIAKVEKGSGLVVLSNQNLLGIAEGIQKVADIMGDVSSATNEQFTAIDQISDTVTQLDTATQENTTLVDSLTNSSDQLKNIVAELNVVVSTHLPSDLSTAKSSIISSLPSSSKKDVKKNVQNQLSKVSVPENSKVAATKVPVANAKVKNSTLASTSVKKTIVKKVGIKKPEVKKWVTKKSEVITGELPQVELVMGDPVEMINENLSGKKVENKPPTVEKIVKKTVKKVQNENTDDIVESILSKDPNFFDSGEDF